MPHDSHNSPPEQITKELIHHCERNGLKLIIGTDCNSHNEIWGSTDNNSRGEELLEFIFSTNLHICNIGNEPTFVNVIRNEVIDITLATPQIVDNITNWKVCKNDMLSDHRAITFEVDFNIIVENRKYRNPRTTNWDNYRYNLKNELENITYDVDLNKQVNILNKTISTAYVNSCREKTEKKKRPDWWNAELSEQKRELKRLRRKYHTERTEENRVAKNRADMQYKNSMKRAKIESWQNYCDRIESLDHAARLQKIMKNGRVSQIGSLKKPDGNYTESPTETLAELVRVLFPENEPYQGNIYQDFLHSFTNFLFRIFHRIL